MNTTLNDSIPGSQLVVAADRTSTPFYHYSLGTLRDRVMQLRSCFSEYPVRLLFATMANDRPEVLRTIASLGVGACVNSLPHLFRARDSGFMLENAQFTSSGLPVDDMLALQRLGVATNLDSPSQVSQWCELAPGAAVGVRLNAASLCGGKIRRDRMGTDAVGFTSAQTSARARGGRVSGIHIYAGTNFQSASAILEVLSSAFEFAAAHCPEIDYINLGGGIGVDYGRTGRAFEYGEFGSGVCSLARHLSSIMQRDIEVFCEPGRGIVASSGVLVTRVTDIKALDGEMFAAVDASVSIFPRPFHQPDTPHHVRLLGKSGRSSQTRPFTLVGRTTFSRDILGRTQLPTDLAVGDLLAFDDAGAYCESMISRFLGQADPAVVICNE